MSSPLKLLKGLVTCIVCMQSYKTKLPYPVCQIQHAQLINKFVFNLHKSLACQTIVIIIKDSVMKIYSCRNQLGNQS